MTKLKCLKDFLITDRNQYLLTSSCHPTSVTNNIPFSLALRLVRICSEVESRDKGLMELKRRQEYYYYRKLINRVFFHRILISRFFPHKIIFIQRFFPHRGFTHKYNNYTEFLSTLPLSSI